MNPEQAQFLLNFLASSLERDFQSTRKVIAAIPENKGSYKPDEHARTAIELAEHLATTDTWFLNSVAAGKFDPENKPGKLTTVADALAYYDKEFPAALQKVKSLPAEKLTRPIDFLGMFNHPAVVYLSFAHMHMIHHRGQLSTYLRPMGSKVPSIYGGSFDEPFQAAATA